MPSHLSTPAVERSTYAVGVTFTDDNGALVTPNSGLTWTLTDDSGSVINSRSAVAITPATSVTIVLHGDDLAIGTNGRRRILYINGTYDSSLGSGLELKDEVRFEISDLVNVS